MCSSCIPLKYHYYTIITKQIDAFVQCWHESKNTFTVVIKVLHLKPFTKSYFSPLYRQVFLYTRVTFLKKSQKSNTKFLFEKQCFPMGRGLTASSSIVYDCTTSGHKTCILYVCIVYHLYTFPYSVYTFQYNIFIYL